MSFVHFEHSLDREHPATELDVKNFTVHLSDEYAREKVDGRDDYVQTETKVVECKTEDCADFKDASCISGGELKQEDEVRILGTKCVAFYCGCFLRVLCCVCVNSDSEEGKIILQGDA